MTGPLGEKALDMTLRLDDDLASPACLQRQQQKQTLAMVGEVAPEPTEHSLPLLRCAAYDRVDDQLFELR